MILIDQLQFDRLLIIDIDSDKTPQLQPTLTRAHWISLLAQMPIHKSVSPTKVKVSGNVYVFVCLSAGILWFTSL